MLRENGFCFSSLRGEITQWLALSAREKFLQNWMELNFTLWLVLRCKLLLDVYKGFMSVSYFITRGPFMPYVASLSVFALNNSALVGSVAAGESAKPL